MKRATHFWRRLIVIATIALLVMPTSLALAARPDGKGPPNGGETAGNNLSVPAIFVPNAGAFTGVTCGVPAVDPTGEPSTGYPTDGYYYVQGENTWQAQCEEALADGSVHATADWGDNLTGAPLKAGTPIRVEVGLLETTPTAMTGFNVVKLQPDELDRVSAYGTLATLTGTGYVGNPVYPYDEVRVWDSAAELSIVDNANGAVVYSGPATAEINSTGRVVYGYNWGTGRGKAATAAAGVYTITFSAPSVTLDGVVLGEEGTLVDSHTITLEVTVASSSGGGQGNGGRSGGGNGPKH